MKIFLQILISLILITKADAQLQINHNEETINDYLKGKIIFPDTLLSALENGKILAHFVYGNEGKIKDVKLLAGLDPKSNKHIKSIIQDFNPAEYKWHRDTINPGSTEYFIPILFNLKFNKEYVISPQEKKKYFVDGIEVCHIDGLPPGEIVSVNTQIDSLNIYNGAAQDGIINIQTRVPNKSRIFLKPISIDHYLDSNTVFDNEKLIEKAEFIGSKDSMITYMYQNILYPDLAKSKLIEGEVLASFTIDKEGKVQDPKIIKGIGGGCDETVLKFVQKMPNWKPASFLGQRVMSSITFPFNFTITESDKEAHHFFTNLFYLEGVRINEEKFNKKIQDLDYLSYYVYNDGKETIYNVSNKKLLKICPIKFKETPSMKDNVVSINFSDRSDSTPVILIIHNGKEELEKTVITKPLSKNKLNIELKNIDTSRPIIVKLIKGISELSAKVSRI
jgi:TonB family protein